MRWVDYDLQSVANHHKKRNNKSIISYYSVRPFSFYRHVTRVDIIISRLFMTGAIHAWHVSAHKSKNSDERKGANVKFLR